MTSFDLLKSKWQWESFPIIVAPLLIAWAYILFRHKKKHLKNWLSYLIGAFILIIAMCSPLAFLSKGYLFFAHMSRHVMILMILPALFWVSLPDSDSRHEIISPYYIPVLSWASFLFVMWLMHLPWIINTMLGHSKFAIEHKGHLLLSNYSGLFINLIFGLWFYFPVLAPKPFCRLNSLKSVAYLVSACMGCSLLGITITFASEPLYEGFSNTSMTNDLFDLIRNQWDISPEKDQQIAGLIMWVPGCLIYLSISLGIFLRGFILNKKDANCNPYD